MRTIKLSNQSHLLFSVVVFCLFAGFRLQYRSSVKIEIMLSTLFVSSHLVLTLMLMLVLESLVKTERQKKNDGCQFIQRKSHVSLNAIKSDCNRINRNMKCHLGFNFQSPDMAQIIEQYQNVLTKIAQLSHQIQMKIMDCIRNLPTNDRWYEFMHRSALMYSWMYRTIFDVIE